MCGSNTVSSTTNTGSKVERRRGGLVAESRTRLLLARGFGASSPGAIGWSLAVVLDGISAFQCIWATRCPPSFEWRR